MNHADNADGRWIHLVVHTVRKPSKKHATETTENDSVLLWRLLDTRHSVVHSLKELMCCNWRSREIPLERRIKLGPRDLANTEPMHLPELLAEFVPYV